MGPRVPPYFEALIAEFRGGRAGRSVHLGLFDAGTPGDFEAAQARLTEILLDMADLRDGLRVLDVGCGLGGTIQAIDARHRGAGLVGLNIDPRQLAICRELRSAPGNRLDWILGDACRLPFAPGSFDRVVCIEAAFHFRSRRAFYGEAARVLAPGGVLVLSDIGLDRSRLDPPGASSDVETYLDDGFGPWPDPWGEEGTPVDLARAAGLMPTRMIDATEATRPSHRFTVPPGLDPHRDPGHPLLRAALILRWLHEREVLSYRNLRFDKPAAC